MPIPGGMGGLYQLYFSQPTLIIWPKNGRAKENQVLLPEEKGSNIGQETT